MSSYSLEEYSLAFSSDYQTLNVKHKSTGEIEKTINIVENPLEIKIEKGRYILTLTPIKYEHYFSLPIDTLGEGTVYFEENKIGGVGTIDLRDVFRPDLADEKDASNKCKFELFLDIYPVSVEHNGTLGMPFYIKVPKEEGVESISPEYGEYTIVEA